MLKECQNMVKKSFKKNKNTLYIVVLLLITFTFLIQSISYPLIKPLYNRIINIGLIIGIIIHIYHKNVCLAFLLLITLILINYYGAKKKKVYSYNKTHTDKYLIEDNSIFSNIKLLFNNHSEYFTEFVEGGVSSTATTTGSSTATTAGSSTATTAGSSTATIASNTIVPMSDSKREMMARIQNVAKNTASAGPTTTGNTASVSPTTTGNTPPSNAGNTTMPPGASRYEGFMGAELFSAQNNVVPESTKVDNVQQPLEGINEYGCGGGNILNTDSPMGFDPKCQMNCSNV